MNIYSLFDRYPINGALALASSTTNGEKGSASASVSIRATGEQVETTATNSVMDGNGVETKSTTTTKVTGDNGTTNLKTAILQSGDEITTQTDVITQAEQDDAEAVVTSVTETTINDDVLISSAGHADASGADPMASVGIQNDVDIEEDAQDEVTGNVEAEASVRFAEEAEAEAKTLIEVDPALNVFEDGGKTTDITDDGFLVVQSFSVVEPLEVEAVDANQFIGFAEWDWGSNHDLW